MFKNAVIILILISFACNTCFLSGKMLIDNIVIYIKGEKYIGVCMGYKSGRFDGIDVHWNDGKRNHHQIFHVLPVKFKYHHEI